MLIFSKKNHKVSECFNDHEKNIVACFESFDKFFEALFSDESDKNTIATIRTEVDSFENAADLKLRHTVDSVGGSFLPATRSRLISLAQSTDKIANKCQSLVNQVICENIVLPKEIRKEIVEINKITKEQLILLYTAIDKVLNDFAGLHKDKQILDDIRAEESRVDRLENLLHSRIFELDLSLCEKIYYRNIVLGVCQISDIIEDIADQIQIMLVERDA